MIDGQKIYKTEKTVEKLENNFQQTVDPWLSKNMVANTMCIKFSHWSSTITSSVLKKKTNMKKLNWLVNCLIKISCIVDPKKHELQNQPLLSPGKLCWSKVFLSINELYWWLYKSYFMEQLPNSINSWVNIQRSLVNIMETSYPSYW